MNQIKKIILLNQTGAKDLKNIPEKVLRPYMPVGSTHRHYSSSGVTIGPGIDLGNRTPQQVEKQFGDKMDKKELELFKTGAGLKGKDAQKWVTLNRQSIKIKPDQIEKILDSEIKEKDKTIQRIFTNPKFKEKFKVDGKDMLNKMETGYKAVMYDTLYLGRNTPQTREKFVPYLAKIYKGIATAEDRRQLNKVIHDLYNGHKERQKVMSSVIGNDSKSLVSKENDVKSMNSTKSQLENGIKQNNLGGVDFAHIIQEKHFNGFSLSSDYMKMHVSKGGNDPTLKDMVVPLKILYDSNIENKNISISIDPHVPTDPNGPLYEKIYYPAEMEGTYFAQIMVEADYIMKQLKMGVTRLNQPFVYPQSLKKVGLDFNSLIEFIDNPQQRTRQWIVIRDVQYLKLNSDRVQIGQVKMGIEARVQNIGPDGKLIDSEAKPSLQTQKFCQLFTKHYDVIAKEYEEFNILKRFAKATIIARIMRRQGCRIDEKLINNLFEREKTDKSSKIIPRMSQTMDLNLKQTPLITLKGDFVKLFITGGCELNYKVDDKKLDIIVQTAESDQEKQQEFVPFIFQDVTVCDEKDCSNICSNGYRTIKDTKCSQHTKYICSFCFELMKQGEQYIQLGDERFAHRNCLKCQGCYEDIAGEYTSFEKLMYHRACVPKISVGNCYVCKQQVHQNTRYFTNNKGFLHEECSKGFKCKTCQKAVDLNEIRSINDDMYHKNCVICGFCMKPILDNEFKNCDNKFAHVGCLPKYTCKGCKQDIKAAGVTLGSDMYHLQCLKCSKCNKQLDGQIQMDDKGRFYHPPCAIASMKNPIDKLI